MAIDLILHIITFAGPDQAKCLPVKGLE